MKLFARKQKTPKANSGSRDFSDEIPKPTIPTPLYQKLATHGSQTQPPQTQPQNKNVDDERWEVVQAPPESPPLPNPHPPPPLIRGPSRASSFNSITTNTAPTLNSPQLIPRSTSPMSGVTSMHTSNPTPNKLIRYHDRERDAHIQANARKKTQPTAPVALGILRALDPPRPSESTLPASHSEERFPPSESGHQSLNHVSREGGEKKEKRGFWGGRDKDRDREKEKERERVERDGYQQVNERDRAHDRERERGREGRREEAELTRMIGYLTATASEDWALVLEVCVRASSSESNAREAVRALRREFKYGEPPAQLSAARLWAIMLRNSSETFITQSTTRKFLDIVEELLNSSKTSPVVRERLLEVVAAAAYASRGMNRDPKHERDGFKGLWKRVKPYDKPDEGMPFDTDDAMFHPPASAGIPVVSYQEPSPVAPDSGVITPTVPTTKKRKSPSRNRIIPPDEDIRRLFQECKIAQGNASLLSQALTLTKPEEMKKKDVIKEFYMKCQSSRELIVTQIPWAAAGADRSRTEQDAITPRLRKTSNEQSLGVNDSPASSPEQTIEEQLFAALLAANEELIEVMRQYDDLERVAMERKAEERSRKEGRRERKRREQMDSEQTNTSHGGESSSRSPSRTRSRSRSPHPNVMAPSTRAPHQQSHSHSYSQHSHAHESDPNLPATTLAPPPAAPHGPRSPAQPPMSSRTPSPTPRIEPYTYMQPNGFGHTHAYGRGYSRSEDTCEDEEDEEDEVHIPSAKALGKRKLVEPETPLVEPGFDPDDIYDDKEIAYADGNGSEPDFEDETDARWRHPPVKFVYDAVAERSRQLQAMGGGLSITNGAH